LTIKINRKNTEAKIHLIISVGFVELNIKSTVAMIINVNTGNTNKLSILIAKVIPFDLVTTILETSS
jgi:hypothetical protein